MPQHPRPNCYAKRLAASHKPLAACMRCPHRGFDLRQIPVRDGRIVRPGHGLVWDATTGEPITEVPEQ